MRSVQDWETNLYQFHCGVNDYKTQYVVLVGAHAGGC